MNINSEKVKQLREKKGWSQEQLSALSGLNLRMKCPRKVRAVKGRKFHSREPNPYFARLFWIINDFGLNYGDFTSGFPPLRYPCSECCQCCSRHSINQ